MPCPAGTPEEVLDWFVDMWRRVVVASNGAAGCVVAGVAVDTDQEADIMSLVNSTFGSWTDLLAQQLLSAGVPQGRARGVATTTLAAMEGALILCRAQHSAAPLEVVAVQLRSLL